MLKKLLQKYSGLIKFVIVGGTAFCVELGSFYVLYRVCDFSIVVANSASFILGLITSFIFNRLWTFRSGNYSKKAGHQFSYYVALALINLLLTNVIVSGLNSFGVDATIAKVAAMITTSLWNHVLYKKIIFKHHPVEDSNDGE